jgi:hypothetical protein
MGARSRFAVDDIRAPRGRFRARSRGDKPSMVAWALRHAGLCSAAYVPCPAARDYPARVIGGRPADESGLTYPLNGTCHAGTCHARTKRHTIRGSRSARTAATHHLIDPLGRAWLIHAPSSQRRSARFRSGKMPPLRDNPARTNNLHWRQAPSGPPGSSERDIRTRSQRGCTRRSCSSPKERDLRHRHESSPSRLALSRPGVIATTFAPTACSLVHRDVRVHAFPVPSDKPTAPSTTPSRQSPVAATTVRQVMPYTHISMRQGRLASPSRRVASRRQVHPRPPIVTTVAPAAR